MYVYIFYALYCLGFIFCFWWFFLSIMTLRAGVGTYLALIQSFLQVSKSYFWNCSSWLIHIQHSTIFPILSNDFPDFLTLHRVVLMLHCKMEMQTLLRQLLMFLTLQNKEFLFFEEWSCMARDVLFIKVYLTLQL